jgi:hypothetical protein
MCASDHLLFFAREVRGRDSPPFWGISDRPDAPDGSCTAALCHGKRRFWLHLPDAPDNEFGFSFFDTEGRNAPRSLRVVIPRTRPYTAASPDEKLAQLAKKGTADAERFVTYHSRQPTRRDGRLVLRFGDVYVIASVKNFIVADSDDNMLFMIYRSSTATCTLKVSPAISPLWAFAWAVAIVTTDR